MLIGTYVSTGGNVEAIRTTTTTPPPTTTTTTVTISAKLLKQTAIVAEQFFKCLQYVSA